MLCGRARLPEVAGIGQRAPADAAGLVGWDAEHAQQSLGDLIGGIGVVPAGLVVQHLAEAYRGAGHDDHGQVVVADSEPPGSRRC